jgi:hypothetical protein
MKIFVRFPSRERAAKFYQVIAGYIQLSTKNDVSYLVTLDEDDFDKEFYIEHCENFKALGHDVNYIIGKSESKIHAINRDMEHSGVWDILVLASDDMHCMVQNWDLVLRNEMESKFPDTDGVLWHWDGDEATKRNELNTMCILGRKYYKRFNYIYHPDYKSLWSDNEFTDVSKYLCKVHYSEIVLFKHIHYSNTKGMLPDELMNRTQRFYYEDEKVYRKRKAINFGL